METKWQAAWQEQGTYQAADPDAASDQQKFYGLIEFPYPSGDGLHVGHPRSYVAIDIVTRKRRMEGKNVLYPIGWDAFGLPTENFAIKHKMKPQDATAKNVANFTRQIKMLGLGFDWSREVNTTDPAYYKWTQWQFLQFLKNDLAYKAKTTINWCPKDKIGLANEEVIDGKCERCGTPVEKREKEQWMIRITKYAERLIADLDTVDYLPKIKAQQINWIGKSEGALVDFALQGATAESVTVFTTRPDTLFGATFLVIAPELAKEWMTHGWEANDEVKTYVDQALRRPETERSAEGKEKTGVKSGVTAINPANNESIPVWIADYVLGNYGTGAIMAVPAHDERDFAFAKKFGLAIKQVVSGTVEEGASVEEGVAMNSGFLDGLPTWKAKQDMTSWLEEKKVGRGATTYKLRDWVFSRQRYWGEPIPVIHCVKCGYVPVPEEQLPVTLPEVEAYEPTDTGESPLAKIRDWVEVDCPSCGGKAERETDTMPNWAGSSWYFLRYCDPQNDQELASAEKLKYWMPVDLYNGGMEHTTLHLLYSRFWYKFLWDIGVIPKECGSEPYRSRRSHGLILAEGGEKMSKSKGNVVNPDDIVAKYGADVFRVYEMFMGPFDQPVPWDTNGIEGVRRFLDKVWNVCHEPAIMAVAGEMEILFNQTAKKITDGIDALQFNTCVSQLMILTNAFQDAGGVPLEYKESYLKLIAPFAPHLAEELWAELGHPESIHRAMWPAYDPTKTKAASFELIVQVNGKMRDKMVVPSDIEEGDAKEVALSSEKAAKWLDGQEIKQVVYVPGKIVNIVTG